MTEAIATEAVLPEAAGINVTMAEAGFTEVAVRQSVGVVPDDGITRVVLPAGMHLTEELAMQAAAQVRTLADGRKRPVLLKLSGVASVSREARMVYNKATSVAAYALLGESPVDRVIANFFIGFEPTGCPRRYFTSEPEAIAWLQSAEVTGETGA